MFLMYTTSYWNHRCVFQLNDVAAVRAEQAVQSDSAEHPRPAAVQALSSSNTSDITSTTWATVTFCDTKFGV